MLNSHSRREIMRILFSPLEFQFGKLHMGLQNFYISTIDSNRCVREGRYRYCAWK